MHKDRVLRLEPFQIERTNERENGKERIKEIKKREPPPHRDFNFQLSPLYPTPLNAHQPL